MLTTKRPADREEIESDEISSRRKFLIAWSKGWKTAYRTKNLDAKVFCPFADPEMRKYFNSGLVDGFDAREQLEAEGIPAGVEDDMPKILEMPSASDGEAA